MTKEKIDPFTTKSAKLVIANDNERVDMYTKLILITVMNHLEVIGYENRSSQGIEFSDNFLAQ